MTDALDPYVRIGELERENKRLQRKLDAEPPRKWLETDDKDVIACMGSAPACAALGCQLRNAEAELHAQEAALQRFCEWWQDHRNGSPNAAYAYVDKFVLAASPTPPQEQK